MTIKEKRPRSVTITLLGVILLGAWSAAQAFAMVQQVTLLLALNIRPDPRLLLGIAAGWMVLFWGLAIMLWCRWPFTRWLIPLLLLLYALYELVLQGLFVRIPISGQSWLLRILLYSVVVLFAIWSLNRNKARSYFAVAQPASMVEEKE
jgi:hypothetical protein